MKKSFYLFGLLAAAALMSTGCEKSTPPRHADDGEIVFAAQGLNFNVQTKATPVTELATFNVLASTGTVGASETQAWAPVAVTKDGSDYLTGKYWPLTDQSYHFYASNASPTFGATGSTVTADGSTDIVVAYLPSPSFKEKNTLTFNHIYARVGNLTLNTQSGYTLSGVSATLKDGVSGGTYNIFSGNGQTDGTGWSGLSAASDRALGAFSSSTTAPVSSNDLWLVPGDYTISVTYTLNKGDYSEQFTKTGTVSLVAGKTNTITATAVGGSASEIKFGVSVTAWVLNDIVLGFEQEPNYLILSGNAIKSNINSVEGTVVFVSPGFTIADPIDNPVEIRFEDGTVLSQASSQSMNSSGKYELYWSDVQSSGIKELDPMDFDAWIYITFLGGIPTSFSGSIQM